MNLQSIVITNCIGIVLTVLVLYSSHMARKSTSLDSRMLTAMLLVLGSCCLMEMVSFLVDGHASLFARIMAWVSNLWIYLANPTFSVLWLLYTDFCLYRKADRLTTVYRPHLILLAACWIVILGNIPGKYLFSFTENNIYSREPAAYFFFALALLIILNSAWVVHRYRRTHRKVIFFPVWIFLTPVLIGMLLQTTVYGVSLAWCSTAVGLAALCMSMQNELAYQDALTGVYNRHYLDFILNSWLGHSGIMIDLDFFKEINDRFGHSQGDRALRDTAGILMDIGPDGSIAIRLAGDEFILLLPTKQEELILATEEKIRSAVEAFNQTADRPYRISLSMGHAVYSQSSADRFLEALDHAMYRNKQRRHESGQLADRRRPGGRQPPVHREVRFADRPSDAVAFFQAIRGHENPPGKQGQKGRAVLPRPERHEGLQPQIRLRGRRPAAAGPFGQPVPDFRERELLPQRGRPVRRRHGHGQAGGPAAPLL